MPPEVADPVLDIGDDCGFQGDCIVRPDGIHGFCMAIDAVAFLKVCSCKPHERTEAQPDGFHQIEQDRAGIRFIERPVKGEVQFGRAQQVVGGIGLADIVIDFLELIEAMFVDVRQGPFCSQRFKREPRCDDLFEFGRRHARHPYPAIIEMFEGTFCDKTVQGFANRHGADAEICRDPLDGDGKTGSHGTTHDACAQGPVDPLLDRFLHPALARCHIATKSMLARSLYNGLPKRWYTHIFLLRRRVP